jgi:hypothetical protein
VLHVPESRIGHVLDASDGEQSLVVTFRLATEPGRDFTGHVSEIQRTAEPREREGNAVLVRVAIDAGDLPHLLRPGADVIAKIHCGRTNLAYAWGYDIVAFVQSKIWFKLW